MIINGKVYRDEKHPKWCLCPECVTKDAMKQSFVESYQNTFGKEPEDATEEETDSIAENNHRIYSRDQSDGTRADND